MAINIQNPETIQPLIDAAVSARKAWLKARAALAAEMAVHTELGIWGMDVPKTYELDNADRLAYQDYERAVNALRQASPESTNALFVLVVK